MKPLNEWAFADKKLSLRKPVLVGILNVTPDSFSDGGRFLSVGAAHLQAKRMISEGASIIDVGGESTRPGAQNVSSQEELARVLPVVSQLKKLGTIVSIDTRKHEVAKACLEEGASIINDVSGFCDAKMVALAAKSGAGAVVMHMKGTPQTMQEKPFYRDVVKEVGGFFADRLNALRAKKVEKIILDPGIGFGKTLEHNLDLLANLHRFTSFGCPLMVGTSRKSFIGKITGGDVQDRLDGTIASNVVALSNGATFFRVHDVLQNSRALEVAHSMISSASRGKVIISGLHCAAKIGVTGQERATKQTLIVDSELDTDMLAAAKSGDVNDTVNYSDVVAEIRRIVSAKEHVLLETLASEISSALKKRFRAKAVRVKIGKQSVAKMHKAGFVGVEYAD